jgi:hypothetical protein
MLSRVIIIGWEVLHRWLSMRLIHIMSLERDRLAEEGRMNQAFGDESVFDASEQELRLYLKVLCREAVPNEWVRHREIIRGITINNLMMAHVLRRLSRSNTWLSIAVGAVSVASLVASIIQVLR